MSNIIPISLLKDRYWASLIHLFKNHDKLNQCFNTRFFDIKGETIKVQSLKKHAAPWSTSEKVMLNLALHLFNEKYKFTLSDIDYLDEKNRKLAFEAMRIRFRNY
ncbi:hypothetical protein J27TS8_27340 [Robertmurraya siralis]|uniref:Uncharacterized protein n=1 Tax=Robertmurraya siralis TaxID=77777 RepID=A0A919WIN5_9BACI|nr:hypothetical protein [Robertmurraya siralis]GIN62741.1 hypothetical protein J27TS8_27340 [Robertmurraya siralis]